MAQKWHKIGTLVRCLKQRFFYILFPEGGDDMLTIHNENPDGKRVDDCVIRSISALTGQDWDTTLLGLTLVSIEEHDLPHSNTVWRKYLRKRGYRRHALPDTCPDCYTVGEFAADHPEGDYLVWCDGHVVAVMGGKIIDTYDSTGYTALYYWQKEE